MADKITRIAIVDTNKCKPKRCAQECKKVRQPLDLARRPSDQNFQSCPVVKMGPSRIASDAAVELMSMQGSYA